MDLDVFRGVVAFVCVAEEKSVRKAAVRLGVSPAAVSKSVSALEEEVGVKLFVRGPREAALTSEGEMFLAHCRPALLSVKSGRAALDARNQQVQGELSISAPFVAAPLFVPAIALLRERYKKLTFALKVTDRLVRIGEESIDVAIRIGQLDDSRLVAKKLRGTTLVTVASPAYLARAGIPRSIDELSGHACLGAIGPNGKPFEWLFRSGPRPIGCVVMIDHSSSLLDAALGGLGVTQVFDFMAAPALREGKLVQLLEAEQGRGPDIFAVCAPGRQSSARVRAAIDCLAESLARSELQPSITSPVRRR